MCTGSFVRNNKVFFFFMIFYFSVTMAHDQTKVSLS